jgi:predicted amidohydrolase YtcJ
VVSLALTAAAFAQAPDTMLLNGKIVTADERGSVHQALAVRDGHIVAVGKSAAIKRLAGKKTRVVDLAVLSKDYLGVPVGEIGAVQSLLTMVGGRVVYADGRNAKFE